VSRKPRLGRPKKGQPNLAGEFPIRPGIERRQRIDEWRQRYASEHGLSLVTLLDAVNILLDRGLATRED
jgi:hypothetical protein